MRKEVNQRLERFLKSCSRSISGRKLVAPKYEAYGKGAASLRPEIGISGSN